MGTLSIEDEEAALKKKLSTVEDLDERRKLRAQIRELRNKKFEDEIKKISEDQGDYVPPPIPEPTEKRSASRRDRAEATDAEADVYGLLQIEDEAELQELLNNTPYEETDKRRKIRARMRDVRNAKFDQQSAAITSSRSSRRASVEPSTPQPTADKTATADPTASRREARLKRKESLREEKNLLKEKETAEKAKKEAEEKSKREEAERVKREEEERVKREAEEKEKLAAEERARKEELKAKAKKKAAEDKARREEEERVKREEEERVKREAEERRKRKAEEEREKKEEEKSTVGMIFI